jgi:site-specific recombinase XerD
VRKPIDAPKQDREHEAVAFSGRPADGRAGSTQNRQDLGSIRRALPSANHNPGFEGRSGSRRLSSPTRSGQGEIDDAALLAAFETHLRLTENRSEATVYTYRTHTRSFRRYLSAHHPEVTLLDVEARHVRAYLLEEAARGLSPMTRATALSAIKALFVYLVAEEMVSDDPAEAVRRPPGTRLRTEVYSEAEAEAILSWAANQTELRWQVGYAVIATFRYTGLRLSELVSLRLDQVDLEARRISLIGKGRKPRVVPIPPALVPVLDEYLTVLRPTLPSSLFVFANPGSVPSRQHYGRYCPRSVANLVQDAGLAAGIEGRHFPHRWRHSYATSLLRRGVDIHLVQRLLGHSNITTTTRYLHLDDADLADAVDQAFPKFDR